MGFEEIALGAERFGGQCHGRNKLAVAGSCAVSAAGTLHRVRAVHDDAVGPLPHDGKIAKIDNQVVVAEAIAPFCQPNLLRA